MEASPQGGLPRLRYFAAAAVLVAVAVGLVLALSSGGSQNRGSGRSANGTSQPSVAEAAPNSSTKGIQGTPVGKSNATAPAIHAIHTTKQGGAIGAGAQAASKTSTNTHGAGAGATIHGAFTVAEVRDPEESKSFPLPASVHHRSASSPSAAGEAAVAPGAASDAQIRKELGEEQHAEAQARAAQQRVLTPVAGGFSVGGNGTIPIPTGVPEAVQRVVAGGNAIADFPYIWGGGHGSFIANGYDCSGSVSYALAAGGLLGAPLVSGDLASWGEPGPGRWITIYANAGHTFMDVDGMWFDTAGRSGPYASRWLVSQPSLAGYAVRHPPGL